MFHIFNDVLKGSKILESVEQRNIGGGGSENKRYYFVSYNRCFQVKKIWSVEWKHSTKDRYAVAVIKQSDLLLGRVIVFSFADSHT